jgi:hypothetical protein
VVGSADAGATACIPSCRASAARYVALRGPPEIFRARKCNMMHVMRRVHDSRLPLNCIKIDDDDTILRAVRTSTEKLPDASARSVDPRVRSVGITEKSRWIKGFAPAKSREISQGTFRISHFAKLDISHFAFCETGHFALRTRETGHSDTLRVGHYSSYPRTLRHETLSESVSCRTSRVLDSVGADAENDNPSWIINILHS